MVLKRPFSDEESFQSSCKLPRQLKCNYQLESSVDIVASDIPCKPHISADESEGFGKSHSVSNIVNGNIAEHTVGADKEFEINAQGSFSSLSGASSSFSEDDSKSDAAVHFSYFPGFFEPDHLVRTLVEHKEISSVVDLPHRRLVSLGPDHQADIPAWGGQGLKNASGCQSTSDPDSVCPNPFAASDHNNDMEKTMGTCVIPLPDAETSFSSEIVNGRTDCSCQDGGSVRCVRQHVLEAREKLRENIGEEKFVELGFSDMGEMVAKKWDEEEEHVFHEVVYSYPASSGENFWRYLSGYFPSRTKKELVSYYFNVFMLRKRGVQNRLDRLNIDSDNDEWQGSEDGDDEYGTTEEDEDSAVESLVNQNPGYTLDQRGHFHEEDEGGVESYSDDSNVREEDEPSKVLEAGNGKSYGNCNSDPACPKNFTDDHDIQDDSCTSYECQPSRGNFSGPCVDTAKQEQQAEGDHIKQFQGGYNGLNGMGNLGYDVEFGDTKDWDVGYLRSSNSDTDFLPTCNMMKEVFGEEAWNNKGRGDSKSIS